MASLEDCLKLIGKSLSSNEKGVMLAKREFLSDEEIVQEAIDSNNDMIQNFEGQIRDRWTETLKKKKVTREKTKSQTFKADSPVTVPPEFVVTNELPVNPVNKYATLRAEDARVRVLGNRFTDLIFKAYQSKSPILKDIVYHLNMGEMQFINLYNRDVQRMVNWESRVPVALREKSRAIFETYRRIISEDTDLTMEQFVDMYGEKTAAVMKEVSAWFDNALVMIIEQQQKNFLNKKPESYAAAILELEELEDDGAPIIEVYKEVANKYQIKPDNLLDDYKQYMQLANYGIKNYVPTGELGEYVVFDPESGNPISFNRTRKLAEQSRRELQINYNSPLDVLGPNEFDTRGINPLAVRKGILRGEKNLFNAMDRYSYFLHNFTTKKPILNETEMMLNENSHFFSNDAYKTLKNTIDRSRKGAYSLFGDTFDAYLGFKLGLERGSYTRMLGRMRTLTARAKFARLGAVMNNTIAGAINLQTRFSFPQLFETHQWLKTDEGKAFIKENEWMLGIDLAIDLAENKGLKPLKWFDPLTLFRLPEPHLRKMALATAYRLSLKSGMSEDQAKQDAMFTNALTTFTYNLANLPGVLQSTEMKTLFQFKNYLIKQAEFFTTLPPRKKAKYLALMLAAGGPRVFFSFIKAIPFLGLIGYFDDAERWLDQQLQTAAHKLDAPIMQDLSFGLAGLLGLDVSTGIALDLPRKWQDFAGPTLGLAIQMYQSFADAIIAYDGGEDMVDEKTLEMLGIDVGNKLMRYSPGLANIWDTLIDIDPDGTIRDWKTRKPKYNVYAEPVQSALKYLGIGEHEIAGKKYNIRINNAVLNTFGINTVERGRQLNIERWLYNENESTRRYARLIISRLRYDVSHEKPVDARDILALARLNIDVSSFISDAAAIKAMSRDAYLQYQLKSIDNLNEIENNLEMLLHYND